MMEEPNMIRGDEQLERASSTTDLATWRTSPVILAVDTRAGRIDPYMALVVEGDHRVLLATSDCAALDILDTQPVDLVLLYDHAGLALIEEIHARGHHDVVIVVLTGLPSMFGAREAMRLGAYAYVSCPCTPRLLRAMLDDAWARRAQEECG
jgi:DNA-binding NtrC family response regulator